MTPDKIEKLIALLDAEITRRIGQRSIAVDPGAMDEVAGSVVAAARGYIQRNVGPLAERVGALEHRRTMAFEGPFDPGRPYVQGDVVQRSGGLYVCLAAAQGSVPGEHTAWRRIADSK